MSIHKWKGEDRYEYELHEIFGDVSIFTKEPYNGEVWDVGKCWDLPSIANEIARISKRKQVEPTVTFLNVTYTLVDGNLLDENMDPPEGNIYEIDILIEMMISMLRGGSCLDDATVD